MPYDPMRHHRRSIRLKGFDYTADGAYFLTICASNRGEIFGSVIDGTVLLNAWGEIAARRWLWLASHYPYVAIDTWIVMPDHLHGILQLQDNQVNGVSARIGLGRKSVGRLMGAFKTSSTREINNLRGAQGLAVWQRDYYEHIIRNEVELAQIRNYIRSNPQRWRSLGRT